MSREMNAKQREADPGADRIKQEQKYDELMAILANTAAEQEKILAHILSLNAETEYLRRYKLDGATDVKTFREKVPVSDYDDYKPFVDRIFEGDKSPLLSAYPVTQLLMSSGTSRGVQKLFPVSNEELIHRAWVRSYGDELFARAMPEADNSRCLAFIAVHKSTRRTLGGLPCHPGTTALITSRAFLERHQSNNRMTSPPEVLLAEDYNESMYCHLLLGLLQREKVGRIMTFFPPALLSVMRSLEQWWSQICEDIANGSLSTIHVKEEKLRSAVQTRLEKLPNLAAHLREVFSASESWKGILARLWPNMKVVDTMCSGTMRPYFHAVTEYAGDVPVICSGMYMSTEGRHGINLDMKRSGNGVCYNLFPGSAYYEFIAVGDDGPNPEVFDLVSLQEGQEYEILVTIISGLYRYRMGDILRVVGHHKTNPTLQLISRASMVLSVDADKTTEAELCSAVEQGSQLLQSKLGWKLVDFTSTTDYNSQPGHYIIFWELDSASTALLLSGQTSTPPTQQQSLEECCATMEAALGQMYRKLRQYNVVGALELRLVQTGTFDQLCRNAVSQGVAPGQFKTPRGIAPESSSLQIMLSNVIKSIASKTKPPF